ncbi:MAG: single-stranded-DNA-specific exonuclease RecJ [Verrucomicrobiales bacterium]|nr:single-stranded-DNA-specific exonuclease RecJ [Verrucomicrobiales bacterium]
MKYRWMIAPDRPLLNTQLIEELHVSPLLAQCLVNRGLEAPETAAAFLKPRLRSLSDPFLLPNLRLAVDRLWRARERTERITIFGDYDVDGVTATALLLQVMRRLGWRVDAYLPHRLDEGYGLTQDAVANCLERGRPDLLLAVDCGSTATDTIRWLKDHRVDVVVLDHHQVAEPPPAAVALVNPQLNPPGPNSLRELCSVGLAFKLAHGLVKEGRRRGLAEAERIDLRTLLDFVALGTLADLVPVVAENRILVTAGIERLNATRRPGLQALREVAQITNAIGPFEVGFQLAPRLNAAGRLEDATEALDLLMAEDEGRARRIAQSLDSRNRERQNLERGIAEEVIGAIKARFNPKRDFVIVEGQLLWHVGVVGIVASRVLHEFYRPVIILGGDGHEWRGSGRSVEGFDLAAALRECGDLLVRHGGHAMAAGLTIDPVNLPDFRARLNRIARNSLTAEQLRPPLRLDARARLADLTVDRLRELGRLQPTGQANPPVQLVVPRVTLQRKPAKIGREHQHVKFRVVEGSRSCEVVWWNGADRAWPEGTFDLACAPQINEFNGRTAVQLRLLDWRPAK